MSITVQHIQESLWLAHIYALAGMAGVNYEVGDTYDYGVDGHFYAVVRRPNGRRAVSGHALDFQAKATINWKLKEGHIVYDLEAKTYDDMVSRDSSETTLLLILLCLPKSQEEWHEMTDSATTIRHCCYWAILSGEPCGNASTQRIFIPAHEPPDARHAESSTGRRARETAESAAMSLEPITDPEAVPLGLLRRYLTAHGWRQGPDVPRPMPSALVQNQSVMGAFLQARPGGRRNFDIYVLSEDGVEGVELVLPREPTASGFLRRIEGAIRTLSDVEGREPQEVIAAVRMIGYDVVRSRIPDTMVHDDTIHLAAAAKYITGIKDLLAATATTEMKPTPFYQRVRPAAVEYADRCRFGHTFRGSFGFTVESPVVPNVEPTLPEIDQPAPFERRVVQRFAHAVRVVCEAVRSDDQARLVADVSAGFSANAYEEFANLVQSTSGSEMVFSFSFSPEWKAPEETNAGDFVVGPRHVEFTRAAAKALRKQAISRPEIVIGRVERLQSENDPSDVLNPGEREIFIQWLSEDLGVLPVRVSLQATDYLAAIEAHKAGRPVKVSGILEGKSRSWRLVNPREFSVP